MQPVILGKKMKEFHEKNPDAPSMPGARLMGVAMLLLNVTQQMLAHRDDAELAAERRELTRPEVLQGLLSLEGPQQAELGQAFTLKALAAAPLPLAPLEELPSFHLGREGEESHLLEVPLEHAEGGEQDHATGHHSHDHGDQRREKRHVDRDRFAGSRRKRHAFTDEFGNHRRTDVAANGHREGSEWSDRNRSRRDVGVEQRCDRDRLFDRRGHRCDARNSDDHRDERRQERHGGCNRAQPYAERHDQRVRERYDHEHARGDTHNRPTQMFALAFRQLVSQRELALQRCVPLDLSSHALDRIGHSVEFFLGKPTCLCD